MFKIAHDDGGEEICYKTLEISVLGLGSSNVVVHHGLHAELSFDAEPRLHLKVGEAENTGADKVGWLVGDGVKIIKGRKKVCF